MKVDLLTKWFNFLAQEGVIQQEDQALYRYGLQQGLVMVLNIGTSIMIGVCLDAVLPCLVFMLCYLPLRSMAGGYHARTQVHCYLLGIVLVAGALLGIKLLPWTSVGAWLIATLAGGIIWYLAPVADANKPLDAQEIESYRCRARKMLMLEWLVLVAMSLVGKSMLAVSIAAAIAANAIMTAIGQRNAVRDDRHGRNSNTLW